MKKIFPVLFICLMATSCKDDEKNGGKHDSDSDAPSELYTVTVNDEPVIVTRMDRFATPVQFVRFDLSKPSVIKVSPGNNSSLATAKLSPERLGIQSTLADNSLTFTVAQPAYLILTPESGEQLFILMDPPEVSPPSPAAANVVNVANLPGIDNTGATLMTALIQGAIDAASGAAANVVYIPAGTYLVGELWMRDNMTLYLADGATLKVPANFTNPDLDQIVYGSAEWTQREAERTANLNNILTDNTAGSAVENCLHAVIRMNGVTNSHLRGRGIIDGSGSYLRHNIDSYLVDNKQLYLQLNPDKSDIEYDSISKYNLLKIEDSTNCTVEGVTALDTAFWNTIVYRSDQIELSNYKVINQRPATGWNETDGVDFDNSTNSTLSHAFLYTGDDCMATKSDDIEDDYVYPELEEGQNYPADPSTGAYISVDNLLHQDVVCYTNQSATKIGTKTMGTDFGNVTFNNIDVIKCGRGLVVDAMDTARVHDIFFKNITFEYVISFDPVVYNISGGTAWRYSEGTAQVGNLFAENIYLNDFQDAPPGIDIRGRIGKAVVVPDTDSDTADSDSDTGEKILPEYPIGTVKFTNFNVNGVRVTAANMDSVISLGARVADDITFE